MEEHPKRWNEEDHGMEWTLKWKLKEYSMKEWNGMEQRWTPKGRSIPFYLSAHNNIHDNLNLFLT